VRRGVPYRWLLYQVSPEFVPKYHIGVVARLPTIRVSQRHIDNKNEERIMWTKPAYTDLRIGFEVTMYFANR